MAKHTVLFEQHQQAGANFVEFSGWEMPIHYGSQIDEHQFVRKTAGMFDVSHMTVLDVLGVGAREFLRYLLANDVDTLSSTGKAMYTCMLNQRGGVIDDLIVYLLGPDKYRLVLNAGTYKKDIAWLEEQARNFSVGLQELKDSVLIAVQGPQAREKVAKVLTPVRMDAATTLERFEAVEIDDWFIARTGYTGEDGFEILVPVADAASFWQDLLAQDVKPCGLGARDTLRLEAGLCLYGSDMDDDISPLEAGLAWTVAWQPEARQFIGRSALERQRDQGLKQKFVGLVLEDKGVLRNHQKVIVPNIGEGEITSGSFAPTLQRSIAFARVPVDTGSEVFVEVRNKQLPARVVKPRFVREGKILITL